MLLKKIYITHDTNISYKILKKNNFEGIIKWDYFS